MIYATFKVKHVSVAKQSLGKAPFIVFLALISSGAPIATDLYLPALPDMPAALGEPISTVNLTLTAYFLFQALGTLIIGSLSDRYGRKRPLGWGLALFIGGGTLCALAQNVWLMIAARALQGFGGGGLVSLATALTKDCFEGKERQNALVIIQAIGSGAPLVAPVLGSGLLLFTDWRGTFAAQVVIGLCALPCFVQLKETVPPEERIANNPLALFSGFRSILRDRPVAAFLLGSGLSSVMLMAYVTSASYVYIDFFGLSKIEYSFFFAFNSATGVIGALMVPFVLRYVTRKKLLTIIFSILPLASVMHLLVAESSPFVFMACIIVLVSLTMSVRPVSINILMGMHDGDTGALSSLINFSFSLFGCVGSLAISQAWPSYIIGVGVISLFVSLGSLIIWLILVKTQCIRN